jgi:peptidoglycan hydrolase-like protein with peptidoglycan-binding domain
MRKSIFAAAVLASIPVTPLPAAAQTPAPPPLSYTQVIDPQAVSMVQQRLKGIGSFNGEVDGKWGPDSAVALQQFQQTHGLQVTGELNQATVTMLGLQISAVLAGGAPAPPPAASPAIVRLDPSSVRAVQQQLLRYGFYHGPIDGVWGGGTEAAMNGFQSQQGLPRTAILNGPTVRALGLDPNSMAVIN